MKSLLIFILVIPQISLARTIFEPNASLTHGGYSGKLESPYEISSGNTAAAGTTFSSQFTTLGLGLRYGITRRYIHFTAIVDGFFNIASNDITNETETKFSTNIGVGIGYEWNIPLRTYLILGVPNSGAEISYYFNEDFLIGFRYNRMEVDIFNEKLNYNSFGVALSIPIEFDYPNHWWRKRDWQ